MYTALLSNPFSKVQEISFSEFRRRMQDPLPSEEKGQPFSMDRKQMIRQVEQAGKILDSFVPEVT